MTDINPDAPGFNPGAFPSRPDDRDFQYPQVAHASSPFDWNKGFDIEEVLGTKLKPKDQGTSGSCGGQAWAMQAAVLEALATKTFEERSAKFIYAQTAVPGGGSDGRSNAKIYSKQGCSYESVLPSYENGKTPSELFMQRSGDITDAIRVNAKLSMALSYATPGTDIDSIAQALRDNNGVIIGICGADNGTWRSDYPKVPKNGDNIWRHWLYVGKAKLIKGKKYIGVINSWGTSTGDRGWQWLSADYVNATIYDKRLNINQRAVWEAWTHVHNPKPVEPGFTHNFKAEIRFGQTSNEVVALQKALQVEGDFPKAQAATGYYGDITRRAVLSFQVRYKVASTAELVSLNGRLVGPATRTQLNKLFNK